MKRFALAATAALGLITVAAPAHAALFSWDIEYSGWWEGEGGGSIFGTIVADEDDAADGVVSADELKAWEWSWSGNDAVSAFSISSEDENAEIQVVDPSLPNGFYGDGTPNQPFLLDDLDQSVFAAGDFLLDLEFLFVQEISTDSFSAGSPDAALATVTVSEPTAVPEPATVLSLLALAGVSGAAFKRRQQEA